MRRSRAEVSEGPASRRRLLGGLTVIGGAAVAVAAWLRFGPSGETEPGRAGTATGQTTTVPSAKVAAPAVQRDGEPDAGNKAEGASPPLGPEPASQAPVESRPDLGLQDRPAVTGGRRRSAASAR